MKPIFSKRIMRLSSTSKWRFTRRNKKTILIATALITLIIFVSKIASTTWSHETVPSNTHLHNLKAGKDFVDFPIYAEGDLFPNIVAEKSAVSSKENLNIGVKIFQDDPEYLARSGAECVSLKTHTGSTPICIFNPEDDRMISAYVKDNGTWEPELLNATTEVVLSHPDMHFVDIGCNIGVFTLTIASLGRKVVSVDPMTESLQLLSKSLNLGRLRENVTLISNALSDVRGKVILQIVSGNKGGSYINTELGKNGNSETFVEAILMDDLIPHMTFEKAFMKIDIEGSEFNAFKGASVFLQSVDVRYILMEWMLQRRNDNGRYFVEYLLKHGFLPYSDVKKVDMLQPDDFRDWPDNIFWIKR